MRITQRQSTIGVFALLFISTLLLFPLLLADPRYTVVLPLGLAVLVGLAGLAFAYARGWQPARLVLVALITLAVAFGTPEPFVTQQASLTVLLPSVLALILAPPGWVGATLLFTLLTLCARAGWHGIYADPTTLVLYGMLAAGMALARTIAETAHRAVEEQAQAAAAAQARAEHEAAARTAQLADVERARAEAEAARRAAAERLETIALQQAVIREMSVPILPVSAGTLVMPLVGELDGQRMELVREQALRAVAETQAREVLLDITGVPVVDTEVAQGLIAVAQAGRLLGARVALVGVRPEVAQAIVALGISIALPTFVDLQTALARSADQRIAAAR